jgi:hypothetical protein
MRSALVTSFGEVAPALAVALCLELGLRIDVEVAQVEEDDGRAVFEADLHERIGPRAARHDRMHAAGVADARSMQSGEVRRFGLWLPNGYLAPDENAARMLPVRGFRLVGIHPAHFGS